MIPREILKKIRQIELRTNRIVTATPAGRSFQAVTPGILFSGCSSRTRTPCGGRS